MAANDARARHVLEACRRLEIRVPEDIAVIGVDNDELICNLAHPPLTSIVQGTEQIGYRAAEMLDRLMNHHIHRNEHLLVDPVGIITRQSTDLVATEDVVASTALTYIRQHAVEARHCYERVLVRKPTLAGQLTLKFEIGKAGLVTACAVQQHQSEREVGDCLCARARGWRFPEPEGGTVTVTYNWTFSPPAP